VTETKEMARETTGKSGTSEPKGSDGFQGRSPLAFARDTVTTAFQLKTGENPNAGIDLDIRAFSMHKAKAMRLGVRSFPTFVIRTNQQRSTYSVPGREDEVLPAGEKR
jgi:hypothetical protein